jgi:hypothetical protein
MQKLTFTSVELDKFSRNKEGCSAKFRASLNSQVIGKMGWTEIPECLTGADLEGELTCISLELIPSDEALSKHATQLDLAKIGKFQTVRLELENKKGKGHRTELRFTVETTDPQAARKLELYLLVANKSRLVISYEPPAKQEEMPLTETESSEES